MLREEDWQDVLDMLAVSSIRAEEMRRQVEEGGGPGPQRGTTTTNRVTHYIAE